MVQYQYQSQIQAAKNAFQALMQANGELHKLVNKLLRKGFTEAEVMLMALNYFANKDIQEAEKRIEKIESTVASFRALTTEKEPMALNWVMVLGDQLADLPDEYGLPYEITRAIKKVPLGLNITLEISIESAGDNNGN